MSKLTITPEVALICNAPDNSDKEQSLPPLLTHSVAAVHQSASGLTFSSIQKDPKS